ncbi:hypothetical protein BDV26DRAFT_286782 [Aspergillus bertholletiae]|uniref:Uncharacterized protein n=1 Tax=Aspergillus bertholletiae TaxID=1226010 RepID=A0A5N7AR04_9EURO|nr:hypothetical protein BDV26DRAFT_286782 [Aspergillus bertholletiae]
MYATEISICHEKRTYHVVSQGDDNELCVLRSLFDVRSHDRDLKHLSGINFVHDVQRRRLVMVQGENQGQTGQCLLTTGQVANFQLRITTHCDHLVHLLQTERDDAKPFHESVQSSGSKAIEASLSTVAGCQGSIEIRRTSFVEINRGVLRFLFQGCNSGFQRLFIHLQ